MIVTKITTSKFAKHDSVSVDLPRKGIVLVTGKNGHGKSTIAEAVAQGVWGKPIRGEYGWRTDAKSGVRIDFEGGHVLRNVSKKHVLKWRVGDDGAGDYPTRSKSQAELETHVGSFHVWRHACAFHTKDASVFTEATDAERKRLLEDVLELSRVEKAYRKGQDEVRESKKELATAAHKLELAQTKLAGLEAQKQLLTGEYEDVPDIDAMRAERKEFQRQFDDHKLHHEEWQAALTSARETYGRLDVQFEAAKQRASKFQNMEHTCSECEQELTEEHLEKQRLDTSTNMTSIEVLHTKAYHQVQHWKEALEKARLELEDWRAKLAENATKGRDAVAAQKRNDARKAKEDTIDADIAAASEEVTKALLVHEAAQRHLQELEAGVQVLSYTGARAGLLAGAVAALESFTNTWLAELGLSDLSVSFDSQSTSKKGAISDKISFEVHGAGGGRGYKAASTGEQRRIDIAVLLALGDLAADARGLSDESTVFFDELFHGLDEEGFEAAVAMLKQLATKRCVVVITHSEALQTALAPDLHLHAENGSISGK